MAIYNKNSKQLNRVSWDEHVGPRVGCKFLLWCSCCQS